MDIAGGLTDDLQELNLDRPTKAVKSSEELERLTVDEKLTGIERAVYLLSSGQEVQRISVIIELPSLLKENNAECMRRVTPKVREVLYVAQQDMQLAAATAFLQILQDKLVPLSTYTQTFLQTILTSVDSKDAEVSAAWLTTLLDVIDLLPTDVIKKDILGIAINKGQLQQPVPVRISCCKILGKMATKFESFLIKKEIQPVVQQLCQDVEHEVRACMCYQLDSVARGLGLENTKSAILPEIVELTNDEESNVRIAGIDTIVNILSMLDNDTVVMMIVPLVCKLCQKAMQAEDSTLPVVAKHLGKLCHGLQGSLTDEQKQWFVDYFKKLCRVGLVKGPDKTTPMVLPPSYEEEDRYAETRHSAAFNMPAMTTFVGMKNFKSELLATLSALCKDPHHMVRKTTASGFHEISKIMGQQAIILFPDLIALLKDENIEVLQGIVSSLPASLEVVSRHGAALSETKTSVVLEVVNTFLAAEEVVFASNNWRLQEDMVRNMGCLGRLCPQDLLYNRVVPILLSKMKHGRALPVRHAAARSLLVLMRCLHRLEQREQLIHTLIQDFCHGRSCHSRGLFIVICKYFIELYSKAFFKEHLFEYVLPLTTDPVPNIRMRACALLPSLKRLIKLPYDNALKGSLEQYVRKLLISDEHDKDVTLARTKAVDEMDLIPVQMESMVSRRKNFEDDEEDQAKEDEEKLLLEIEERERKEEELRLSKGDKKTAMAKKEAGKGTTAGQKKLSTVASRGSGANIKADGILGRKDSKGLSSTTSSQPAPPPAGPGSNVNRTKASPGSQRTGNIAHPSSLVGSQQRKGSAGSLPSVTAARRGSLGSASSTSSEPSSSRSVKQKSNSVCAPGASTLAAPSKPTRKLSKQ